MEMGLCKRVGCSVRSADAFCRQIRLQKVLLVFLFVSLLLNSSIWFGYSLLDLDSDSALRSIQVAIQNLRAAKTHHEWFPPLTLILYSTYLLGITIPNIPTKEINSHWPTVVHISALTSLSAVTQIISLLVPLDSEGLPSLRLQSSATFHVSDSQTEGPSTFAYVSAFISFLCTLIAMTIPRGPQRYFDPSRVYTLKSLDQTAPPLVGTGQNVSGVVGSGVWGALFSHLFRPILIIATLHYRNPLLCIHNSSGTTGIHFNLSRNPRPPHLTGKHARNSHLSTNTFPHPETQTIFHHHRPIFPLLTPLFLQR